MNITPNEISNKDFKKVFRGYDMDEVDEFLDALVEDYEKLYK
jgi:cell division initiation protein